MLKACLKNFVFLYPAQRRHTATLTAGARLKGNGIEMGQVKQAI